MDTCCEKINSLLLNSSVEEFKFFIDEILKNADNEDVLDLSLLRASDCGRLDVIKLIFEDFDHSYQGQEECFPYCAGDTPLLLAARKGHSKTVKYLLEQKANPFAVDSHGCNAAVNAVISGNVELAKFLIEDCQIAWQGYTWEGTSALQFAVSSRSPRMFGYILSLGGLKYNHPMYGGEEGTDDYPLLHGTGFDRKTKSVKWIKMLHGKFKHILNNYQTNNCSAICQAAEQGDLHKVKQLIRSYEYPLLNDLLVCSACRGGSIDILHYFVDELQMSLPAQALACAVTGANEKLVAELIYERNQNIYQTSSDGETLLHLAVRDGHWRADMDARQTCSIIKIDLLEWGRLDPNAVCYAGSVLDLACRRGDFVLTEMLIRNGAKIDNDALCAAAYGGNVEILNLLLENNSNLTVNSQGGNGTTPLHEAIKAKALDAIKFLVEKGAKTDIADKADVTAADYAQSLDIKLT